MIKCCPTCKQPLPPTIVVGGRRRQALLDYVLANAQGVSREQIMSRVWADDIDGGPECPNIVQVMVRQINVRLEKLGQPVRLRGSMGPYSCYKAVYL